MTETVSGPETILSMESSSSKSTYELSPPLNDLPLVAFDLKNAFDFSFFKSQLKRFCDQISDPIPLISFNPLENLEQLLSPSKSSNFPSFRINHIPTEGEVSLLISYLKALNNLELPVLFEHGLIHPFEVCYQALFLSNKLPSYINSILQQSLAQFSALLSQNQFLSESIEQTTSKVEKLEARAFKTPFHLINLEWPSSRNSKKR